MDRTDLCFAGPTRQLELMRAGELTATELVRAYLERIERFDRELNAYRVVLADSALAAAAEADRLRARGADAPLLGVPLAVKDDVDLAGEVTAFGTQAVTTPRRHDAELARRLRAAGAVVLGRTRMPELGMWPVTQSAFAGATRNPWSLEHSAGGSSGGSAAAVAAGLASAAIGSDGAGSIRIPSAATGVFGLKPHNGRIPLHPHGGHWTGLTAAGPITRRVLDWALLADQLHGPLAAEPDTALPAPPTSFVRAAAQPPGRLRIAVSTRGMAAATRVHPEVRSALADTARLLRELGHEVVRLDPDLLDPTGMAVFAPRYLRAVAESAADVEHPGRLERRTRIASALGRALGPAHRRLLALGARAAERANRVFDRADVLLTPTLPRPAMPVGELERHATVPALVKASRYVAFLPLWNIAGNPAASVPAGFTRSGLPLAVQCVGRPHDECTLLSLAAQIEAARPWADRRPPRYAANG
ncbi:amidase [Streptoalloteichus hindustanus]|uniref:Amidase n=1 Tax=Streptoalloteichus hindustanus TaxID=2017 RepID=A0A1M5PND4_STRHI|nr:amidase [Streptoalloteichus hindustanus]SHH03315.1 amidase [Streptoalloteichus hindustanus]